MNPLLSKTAVVVGVGGLGCPALWSLADSGLGKLRLLDDDVVDEGNLGRQLLFDDADLGLPKLERAAKKLKQLGFSGEIETLNTRLLPHNASQLLSDADVVLEGADNYATKFLTADACHLQNIPVVHGAGVQWKATVWSIAPQGRPCYRCLFEDLPTGSPVNCNSAGVMGPVVGFAGALMADLALGVLVGKPRYGVLFSFDGLKDQLRQVNIPARSDCALCAAHPSILKLEEERYTQSFCAA